MNSPRRLNNYSFLYFGMACMGALLANFIHMATVEEGQAIAFSEQNKDVQLVDAAIANIIGALPIFLNRVINENELRQEQKAGATLDFFAWLAGGFIGHALSPSTPARPFGQFIGRLLGVNLKHAFITSSGFFQKEGETSDVNLGVQTTAAEVHNVQSDEDEGAGVNSGVQTIADEGHSVPINVALSENLTSLRYRRCLGLQYRTLMRQG